MNAPAQAHDWRAENAFYLSATPTRLAKALAQWEAFKLSLSVPGSIVECGVFKGASFSRLALFRQLACNPEAKALIGFDTFGAYAHGQSERDETLRERVVSKAGESGIQTVDLWASLQKRGCGVNVNLIAGDITLTVPWYCEQNPEVKISLLNLDVDFYEPAKVVLENLWPRISHGGVLLLDDYGTFEGETRAVDEFFGGLVPIQRWPGAYSPCYLVKQ